MLIRVRGGTRGGRAHRWEHPAWLMRSGEHPALGRVRALLEADAVRGRDRVMALALTRAYEFARDYDRAAAADEAAQAMTELAERRGYERRAFGDRFRVERRGDLVRLIEKTGPTSQRIIVRHRSEVPR